VQGHDRTDPITDCVGQVAFVSTFGHAHAHAAVLGAEVGDDEIDPRFLDELGHLVGLGELVVSGELETLNVLGIVNLVGRPLDDDAVAEFLHVFGYPRDVLVVVVLAGVVHDDGHALNGVRIMDHGHVVLVGHPAVVDEGQDADGWKGVHEVLVAGEMAEPDLATLANAPAGEAGDILGDPAPEGHFPELWVVGIHAGHADGDGDFIEAVVFGKGLGSHAEAFDLGGKLAVGGEQGRPRCAEAIQDGKRLPAVGNQFHQRFSIDRFDRGG